MYFYPMQMKSTTKLVVVHKGFCLGWPLVGQRSKEEEVFRLHHLGRDP